MFQVDSEKSLGDLYSQTTFFKDRDDGPPMWDNMSVSKADDYELESYPLGVCLFVPQCSAFGSTLIQLGDTYENHGEDCLFIQELVAAYMSGKLRYIGSPDNPMES